MIPVRVDGPADAPVTLVLAHGAGAPMDSPFLEAVAAGLAARGVRVVRFEFPYMRRRREEGVRPGPDRLPTLQAAFRDVVGQVGGRVAIGGKSMGGRVAATLADELGARGLVVLGYPLRPPGRPTADRGDVLVALRTPTLVVQGERDPFGGREALGALDLPRTVEVAWAPDGDHDLAPRRRSGRTPADNLHEAIERIAIFLSRLP